MAARIAYVSEESGRPEVPIHNVSGPPRRFASRAAAATSRSGVVTGRSCFSSVPRPPSKRLGPSSGPWRGDSRARRSTPDVPPIGSGHWGHPIRFVSRRQARLLPAARRRPAASRYRSHSGLARAGQIRGSGAGDWRLGTPTRASLISIPRSRPVSQPRAPEAGIVGRMLTRRTALLTPLWLLALKAEAADGRMTLGMHQNTSSAAGYRKSLEGWARAGIRHVELTSNLVDDFLKTDSLDAARRVLTDNGLTRGVRLLRRDRSVGAQSETRRRARGPEEAVRDVRRAGADADLTRRPRPPRSSPPMTTRRAPATCTTPARWSNSST